jgi:hypothetical protein
MLLVTKNLDGYMVLLGATSTNFTITVTTGVKALCQDHAKNVNGILLRQRRWPSNDTKCQILGKFS